MPTAIGGPSSSRNYMANSSTHVQERGISNAHRLLGVACSPKCAENELPRRAWVVHCFADE